MASRYLQGIKFTANVQATLLNNIPGNPSANINWTLKTTMENGFNSGQADTGWYWEGTVPAGGIVEIDLSTFAGFDAGAGAGLNLLGQSMNPTVEIAAIAIQNNNPIDQAGSLSIYPNGYQGWAPIGTHNDANGGSLYGQGVLIKSSPSANGFAISHSSRKLVLAATGGAVAAIIVIIARSDTDESSSSSSSNSSSSSSSSSNSSSSSSSHNSSSSSSSSNNSSSSSSSSNNSSSSSSSSSKSSNSSSSSSSSSSSNSSSSSVV